MHKKIIVVLLLSFIKIFSINLLSLKDTTKFLDEETQEYAPCNGVPFAEGIAEALYDQSIKNIKKKILQSIKNFECSENKKAKLRTHFENYFQTLSQEELSTLKLVHLLFHKVGNQFQLTEAPNNPIRQLTPQNIGEIFKIILDAKKELKKESVSFATQEEQKYWFCLKTRLRTDLENYVQSLNFQKNSGSFFKIKDFNPFINSLIDSLWECSDLNRSACFAPDTTENILLAYLLQKSNSKKDLEEYLEGLLGSSVELSKEEYTQQEIKEFRNKNIDLNDFDSFSDWLTIAFYKKNYMAGLPKMATTKAVSYDNVIFPDCTETTIRNLCNIATYSKNSLGIIRSNIQMSNVLISFYSQDKANMPSEVSNQDIHQAWVTFVTNIAGLSYLCIKKAGSMNHLKIPLEYQGFMLIDNSMISNKDLEKLPKKEFLLDNEKIQSYEKKVGELTYLLVPQRSHFICFELMPTISNIIVSLDNLFNLNLYKPEEIFEQDFTKKYFKALCHKFNWDLGNSIDNEEQKIIKIYKEESSFQIAIRPNQHIDVSVIKDGFKNIINEKMFQGLLKQKYSRNMSLLVPLFNSSLTMKDLLKLVNNNEQIFLQLVRQIRFDKVERKVNVIEQILNMKLNNPEIDTYLSGLILTLPANNGDYLKFILENFNEDFFHLINNILDKVGSSSLLIPQMEYVNKDGAFDKACSRVNQLKCFSGIIKNSLKHYFYMIAANLKRSETIDLLRLLMLFDILSFQEMIPFLKYDAENIWPFFNKGMYSADDILAYLILARKITFQEVMAFVEKYRHVPYMLDILFFFNRATQVDLRQFMPFLEKGMNDVNQFVKFRTLCLIQELRQTKRITFYEAKPFLKKALEEEVDLKEKRGMAYVFQEKGIEAALIFALNEEVPYLEIQPFLKKAVKDLNSENIILVFKVINDLLDENKITLSQAKPFIKTAVKIKSSDLEYDKEEVQSFLKKYNKKHEETLKSAQQGLLKKTKTVSMYHQGYRSDTDDQDLENNETNFDSEEQPLSDEDFQEYKNLKELGSAQIAKQQSLDDSDTIKDSISTSLMKLLVSKKIALSNVLNVSDLAKKIALKILR